MAQPPPDRARGSGRLQRVPSALRGALRALQPHCQPRSRATDRTARNERPTLGTGNATRDGLALRAERQKMEMLSID